MKITEITEGYMDTQEGWGEFKGAVGRGASAITKATGAVTGAASRQIGDIKNTAMAKMGSGQAQGKKEMQRVVGGVIKNFNRYLGQTGGKPTMATLKQYLTALGFQNVTTEAVPSQAQIAQAQANRDAGGAADRKDTDVLTRNDLFHIIGKNIQQALQTGTLPKELKKFLGQ